MQDTDRDVLVLMVHRADRWVAVRSCRRLNRALADEDCRVTPDGLLASPARCNLGLRLLADRVDHEHIMDIAAWTGRVLSLPPPIYHPAVAAAAVHQYRPYPYVPSHCPAALVRNNTPEALAYAVFHGQRAALEKEGQTVPIQLDDVIRGAPRTVQRVALTDGFYDVRRPFPVGVLCGVASVDGRDIRVQAQYSCNGTSVWVSGPSTWDPLPPIPLSCCAAVRIEAPAVDELFLTFASPDELPIHPMQSGPCLYRLPEAQSIRSFHSTGRVSPMDAEDRGQQVR
jgi:hypothetical protein